MKNLTTSIFLLIVRFYAFINFKKKKIILDGIQNIFSFTTSIRYEP